MIFCDVSKGRELQGGLGNNLFKIATCLSLADQNDVECKLSSWRYYIFENLDFRNDRIPIKNHHQEPFFHYTEIEYKENIDITGYFQSEKYFINNEELIRHSFIPKKEISDYLENKYGRMLNSGTTCSIHVRRGDYLFNPNYAVLDMSYYNEALDLMRKKGINKFIVFSDDINWCKINFNGDEFFFVEGENDFNDLFLMSMCDHHIIANSSFSWWGAWLNANKEKKVIAPKNWFTSRYELDTKDLYFEKSIVI